MRGPSGAGEGRRAVFRPGAKGQPAVAARVLSGRVPACGSAPWAEVGGIRAARCRTPSLSPLLGSGSRPTFRPTLAASLSGGQGGGSRCPGALARRSIPERTAGPAAYGAPSRAGCRAVPPASARALRGCSGGSVSGWFLLLKSRNATR